MKLKDYRNYFTGKLTPLYDSAEAERFFIIALEELKGWNRSRLALNPDEELTPDEVRQWDEVLQHLTEQKPIQYIFGKAWFYGLEFRVNENTLIPRPETEELAEWIISENKNRQDITILDIGTGSGCIAVSLAKNLPYAKVFALDVSEQALEVAKYNAEASGANITFIKEDILLVQALPQQFDIIVSNPPYVRHLEKAEIKDNVLQFEPHLALFVEDDDALLFYRTIAQLGKNGLKQSGLLYFEINQYLGNETINMLAESHYKAIILKKDLFGNDRMVKAQL
jgi:release factor glutamine methyltransferase